MKHASVKFAKSSMILCSLLFILICATGEALATEPRYGYTVATEEGFVVKLMETPDEAGIVWFSYYPGVRIELLSDLADGWAHVRICNIDGYMKSANVSFDPDYMKATHKLPVWILKGVKTDSGTVNFRELPTFEIPPLSNDYYIQEKKEFHVMGISDEWFHVNIHGRMGFFRAEYMHDLEKTSEYVIGSFQSPVRTQWK